MTKPKKAPKKGSTKFYCFVQNNSGGHFVFDKERGLTHFVVIEATSPAEANHRAKNIGIYFDGCDNDLDCSCCGDRWYPASDYDGKDKPSICNEPISEATAIMLWMTPDPEAVLHPLKGKFKWYQLKETYPK